MSKISLKTCFKKLITCLKEEGHPEKNNHESLSKFLFDIFTIKKRINDLQI